MRRILPLLLAGVAVLPVSAQEEAGPQAYFRIGYGGGATEAADPGEAESFSFSYPAHGSSAVASTEYEAAPVVSGTVPPGTVWSWAPGSRRPPGIELDPETGEISGIPLEFHQDAYPFGVVATPPGGPSVRFDFPVVVTGPFTVTPNYPSFEWQVGLPNYWDELIRITSTGPFTDNNGSYETWMVEDSTLSAIPNGILPYTFPNQVDIYIPAPDSGWTPGEYSFRVAKIDPYGVKGYSSAIGVTIHGAPGWGFQPGSGNGYEILTQGNGRPLIRVVRGTAVDIVSEPLNLAVISEPDYEDPSLEYLDYIPPQATLPPGLPLGWWGNFTGTPTVSGLYQGIVIPAFSDLGAYGYTLVDIEVVEAL
jgi:hypothetical protein